MIISKQPENSANFKEFSEIVNKKNINIIITNKGDRINIDKDLYFYILWPDSSDFVSENALNNNSIVCKLVYNNFSMIFTGDIEEISEKEILNMYKNNLAILNSTVLKVAHHGSKTSSTKSFLQAVNPKYALIGVGKNNNFGHPSNVTLDNLEALDSKVYRTDRNGEIVIKTNGYKTNIKELIKE